jgi:hypothetical protein
VWSGQRAHRHWSIATFENNSTLLVEAQIEVGLDDAGSKVRSRISRFRERVAYSINLASFGFGGIAIRIPTILLVLGVRHAAVQIDTGSKLDCSLVVC